MKYLILLLSYGLMAVAHRNQHELLQEQAIKKCIVDFSKAGDTWDTQALQNFLHEDFRIVMNQLFGSTEVNIISRDAYLAKIKNQEFGGDHRKVSITRVTLNGNTASAKVKFSGNKSVFTSIFTLVQNGSGDWQLISELPIME